VYKTAAEMATERKLKSSSSQVVLDMRGPHVRVTSLDKINEDGKPEDGMDRGPLPELQHNVRLLVDLTEADISKLDRQVQHSKDTLIALEHERDKLQASVSKEAITIERLTEVVALIDYTDETLKKLSKENSTIEKRLELVATTFEKISKSYPNEYKNFDLPSLLIIMSFPLWKAFLHNWDPLSTPIPPPPPVPTVDDEEEISVKTEKDEEMSTENKYEEDNNKKDNDIDPLKKLKENITVKKRKNYKKRRK